MADPTSGVAAAISIGAVAGGAGGLALFNSMVPPGIELVPFAIYCAFSIFGAFCAQFIYTLALRQAAEARGIPVGERPTIDSVSLACAMCGAPMGTAAITYGVHLAGGTTGAYSIPIFMAGGALAPQLSKLLLGAVSKIMGIRFGASQ